MEIYIDNIMDDHHQHHWNYIYSIGKLTTLHNVVPMNMIWDSIWVSKCTQNANAKVHLPYPHTYLVNENL